MALAARLAAAAAVAAVATGAPVTSRVVVPLDFGWRHYLGDVQTTCNASDPFPVNMTDLQCSGLFQADGVTDAAGCAAACCSSAGCQVWQWAAAPPATPVGSCWIGQITQPCTRSPGWVSAAANGSALTPSVPQPGFPDSTWELVDLPHDAIINTTFNPNGTEGAGYLLGNTSWYRKHAGAMPAAWEGSAIYLLVENALAVSQWYLNGAPLGTQLSSYTPVIFRLDNSSLAYGAGDNVIAAFVDARSSALTGWWYEGGGLNRHAYLIALNPVHIDVKAGVFAPAFLEGPYTRNGALPSAGATASAAVVRPSVTLVNDGLAAVPAKGASVVFDLYAADGVTLVGTTSVALGATLNASASATLQAPAFTVANPQLWSVARPYLHTLVTTLSVAGAAVDIVNTSIGLRDLTWTSAGLWLNGDLIPQRGFCDHDSFGGVGAAVYDRINLLRFQAQRGMGSQSRRTSHNPPPPALLDIADRLGMIVLDENRILQDDAQHVGTMADLVLRDRNHASVAWWSFCNEVGCLAGGTQPSLDYKLATYAADGTRAVTGNMCSGWGSCSYPSTITEELNMSVLLDVQGFSHVGSTTFEEFHELAPEKPLVGTECCSCEAERGESDVFTADCLAGQIQAGLGSSYVGGNYIWTSVRIAGSLALAPGELRSLSRPDALIRLPFVFSRLLRSTTTLARAITGRASRRPSASTTWWASASPRLTTCAQTGWPMCPSLTRRGRPWPAWRPWSASWRPGRRRRRATRSPCTCTPRRPSWASP